MQLPYRSPQPPKEESTGQSTSTPTVPAKNYQVVGLKLAKTMPIDFQGRIYDLADLSDDDLKFLLQFPEQVPYLKAV